MRILTKKQVEYEKAKVVRELRECLFVYPTDTVYGIGCNATDRSLVHKLRKVKGQFSRPLSVIAPNPEWIRKNCHVNEQAEKYFKKLPGPYTLILRLKNMNAVSRNVHIGKNTIGVRLPKHWFTQVVDEMQIPVITTSANLTGGNFMTDLDDLDEDIKKQVDYVIHEGPIAGKPSMIIDLAKSKPEILRN